MDRPIRLARNLADEGIDERRTYRFAVVLTAALAALTIGAFRAAPAFASNGAHVSKRPDAFKRMDEDGQDGDLVRCDDDTNKDWTFKTGKTALTDGTGAKFTGKTGNTRGTLTDGGPAYHTGKTGNTGWLTDGNRNTGKTGNTHTATDGKIKTGWSGNTWATDGTLHTGAEGNTAGWTDGKGATGPEGNTGTLTDGGRHTGMTGDTHEATDGRG